MLRLRLIVKLADADMWRMWDVWVGPRIGTAHAMNTLVTSGDRALLQRPI